MVVETVARTFEVLELRCRRCGDSFAHLTPGPEMERCDSTMCVCTGCGKIYCLSLWEDERTHKALRAIRRECGGRLDEEAVMIGKLLPACGCAARIAVYDELCPSCGSRNHLTMSVRTETRQVSPLSLAGGR